MPAKNMEELVALCKRRGFIFQSSEIYGGLQGTYDFGPLGVELKNNISKLWWRNMTLLNENIVDLIHSRKEEYFEKFLSENLSPREGVTEIIDLCTKSKIKLGFITTTSLKNINSIKTALEGKIDFSCFDIITSIENVKNPKPDSEVYAFALSELSLDKNDVYVIEDTKANQSAAIELGITCFLNPGEYALVGANDNPNYEISKSIGSIINNT